MPAAHWPCSNPKASDENSRLRSVTERAAYIGRIRNLARAVAQSYVDSRARLGFPMAPKDWAAEVLAAIESKKAA